jgi:1-acyl-sn-glycerol-3-phosphate acyltransferase
MARNLAMNRAVDLSDGRALRAILAVMPRGHAPLTPGTTDPRAVARWRRYVAPLVRLAFRPRLEGIENLPRDRPFLLVANHSGLGLAEILALVVCLLDRIGTPIRLAPMVHPLSMNAWPAGGWMRRLGAIPSTYDDANAALANGISVLVFPGGDHEAMRPVWQAERVDFNGRQGFLKIARGAGNVPILPLGIRGSHYTTPIAYRSGALLPRMLVLPYLMGIRKRFPITLAGVLGVAALAAFGPIHAWWFTAVLAWLWTSTPLSQLPWIPWSIRMRIGTPIERAELFGNEDLATGYERVRGAIQDLVRAA